jgi:dihydrofolate reductase
VVPATPDEKEQTMTRIIVTEFVSLDGVMEDPGGAEDFEYGGWTFEIDRGDEGNQFKLDETMATEALLLGRRTYEGFAAAWPSREGEFADKFNSMPKYVVSSTLKDPDWNNTTVLSGDVVEEVSKLKGEQSGDLVVHGSGQLVPGGAGARPRRRAAPDGFPGHARKGKAPLWRHEREEAALARRIAHRRRRRRDPDLPAGGELGHSGV